VPNSNEPMIVNLKDGCGIKGMMNNVRYGMVLDTLLHYKFPKQCLFYNPKVLEEVHLD